MGRVVGAEGIGDGVAFAAGDGLIAGELIGLAADEDDFFVAANAVSGPHTATAAMHARRICNLFFMVGFWVKSKSYRVGSEKARWIARSVARCQLKSRLRRHFQPSNGGALDPP